MRGIAALLPAKYKFRIVHHVKNSWVATLTPKKQENNTSGEEEKITEENADPIVIFGKPPPMPPVLGPLILLSLLENCSSRDDD